MQQAYRPVNKRPATWRAFSIYFVLQQSGLVQRLTLKLMRLRARRIADTAVTHRRSFPHIGAWPTFRPYRQLRIAAKATA